MGIAGGTMLASQGNAAPNSDQQPGSSANNPQKIASGSCAGKNGCKSNYSAPSKDNNYQASRDVPNNDNMPSDMGCKAHDGCKGQESPKPMPGNGCEGQRKPMPGSNPVANSCRTHQNAQRPQAQGNQDGVYTQWETSDAGKYQNRVSNSCGGAPKGYTADNGKTMDPAMAPGMPTTPPSTDDVNNKNGKVMPPQNNAKNPNSNKY